MRREVRLQGLRPDTLAPATGTVVRILERRRTQIVGTLQRSRQFLYVVPDDPRIPHDISVPPPGPARRPAVVGDKVVVRLRDWPSRQTNPEGEIVDVPGLAMSGLVPLSSLEDDFYVFDATRNQLVDRSTRRVLRLGDRVTVQVFKVDTFKKQVDFRLATDGRPTASQPARTRKARA